MVGTYVEARVEERGGEEGGLGSSDGAGPRSASTGGRWTGPWYCGTSTVDLARGPHSRLAWLLSGMRE